MTATELAQQCPQLSHDYVVSEQVYEAFVRCSGDTNALHTDSAHARQRGFAGRVMHGNILNAFVSHFVGMLLPSRQVMLQSQDISYHAPFYLGQTLHFEVRCDTVSEAVGVVVYKFRFTRYDPDKQRLVARGRVQIGLLT